MTKLGEFDAAAFYAALDGQRRAKNVTWKLVAAESGVPASTLTRMAQGRRPDVDSLAALIVWSGLKQDAFIRTAATPVEPEPLAMISSLLRADKRLSPDAAKAIDEVVRATYSQMRRP